LFFFLITGCSIKHKKEVAFFECILTQYLELYNINLNEEVLILETYEWTDTSSHITLLGDPKGSFDVKDLYYANFKKIDVYYKFILIDSLREINISESFFSRNSEIDFTHIKDIQIPDSSSYLIPTTRESKEIQFIYNRVNKKIEEILKHDANINIEILKNCNFCSR
jgi:hypothetical protein